MSRPKEPSLQEFLPRHVCSVRQARLHTQLASVEHVPRPPLQRVASAPFLHIDSGIAAIIGSNSTPTILPFDLNITSQNRSFWPILRSALWPPWCAPELNRHPIPIRFVLDGALSRKPQCLISRPIFRGRSLFDFWFRFPRPHLHLLHSLWRRLFGGGHYEP